MESIVYLLFGIFCLVASFAYFYSAEKKRKELFRCGNNPNNNDKEYQLLVSENINDTPKWMRVYLAQLPWIIILHKVTGMIIAVYCLYLIYTTYTSTGITREIIDNSYPWIIAAMVTSSVAPFACRAVFNIPFRRWLQEQKDIRS